MERVPTQEILHAEMSITKEVERELTSDIWDHFTKTERFDIGLKKYDIICKHYGAIYKYTSGQGYWTFKRHLRSKYPIEVGIDIKQQQIFGYINHNTYHLFYFNEKTYKKELGKFVFVEYLSFNFGEMFGCNWFVQKAYAPQVKRVLRNTFKRVIKDLYKNEKKKIYKNFLCNLMDVSI